VGHLGPRLTPSANVGSDQFTMAGAARPHFMSIFLFFFFSSLFDQATERTAAPILIVD
jgi:hypothetical protein